MSEIEAPKVTVPKGATHVTVACKLPAGLVLRCYNMVKIDEPVLGGGTRSTTIAEYDDTAGEYRIKGYAMPFGQAPEHRVLGGLTGFALTPGIPAAFWERWVKANADLPAVKKGLIYAHSNKDHVEGVAREQKNLRNNLEPIDPKSPPRVGRLKVEKYQKDDADAAA
jgi:hypothetical protein